MITTDRIREIQDRGFCVLSAHLPQCLVNDCRDAFWPVLLAHLKAHGHESNRGPDRHFLPMPFEPPCYAPEFLFDPDIVSIVRGVMDDRVVVDQWGCDVPGLQAEVALCRQRPNGHRAGRRSIITVMAGAPFAKMPE